MINVPAGHAVQLAAPVAFKVSVTLPAGHRVQLMVPALPANKPGAQSTHEPLGTLPCCPRGHAVQLVAPVGCGLTTLPVVQFRQLA